MRLPPFVLVTIAAGLLLAASVEAGSAGSSHAARNRIESAPSGPAASPRQALRCNPVAHRVIEPLILEEGYEFELTVHFDYDCPEGTKPVVFVIAVEDSDMLAPPGFGGRQLLGNLQTGLTAFVEAIDYDNGSMGGLVLYTGTASVRVPVEGGDGGRQSMLAAIRGIAAGGPTARAAGDAVDTGAQMLREANGPEGALKVLLIVDAGATLDDPDAVIARCAAATAEGVHVAVSSLRGAEGRLRDCSVESSFYQSAREGGQDLEEQLGSMGEGFVNTDRADSVLLTDTLVRGMAYVEGSGEPPPTSSFAGEISWDFLAPAPDGGQEVSYRVKPPTTGDGQMISTSALVTLQYADGSVGEVPLENPDLCVYRSGRPADCADYAATLTPPVPTPTATESPTEGPTSDPRPSDTPEPKLGIYLPSVRRE